MIKKVKSAPLPAEHFRKLKQKTARFFSDFAAVCRDQESLPQIAKGRFFVLYPLSEYLIIPGAGRECEGRTPRRQGKVHKLTFPYPLSVFPSGGVSF